ncbi:nitroreductase family protein [Bradyrhizobium sp. RDM4]|uniref:nitroreductase family protein n=1 Tax=Bradyrhizobium sp. RDM4 TaxID=3378765 RepID=UPI0038FC96C8
MRRLIVDCVSPSMRAAPPKLPAIRDRRSVRAFLDKPVPAATIQEILEIAALSPSSSNMQPWRIYALSGPVLADLKAQVRQSAACNPRPNFRSTRLT